MVLYGKFDNNIYNINLIIVIIIIISWKYGIINNNITYNRQIHIWHYSYIMMIIIIITFNYIVINFYIQPSDV